MVQISDTELIIECQQGKKSSFSALVDRYKDRVYTTVLRIVGNVHDAEEIAQEAFISAYTSIGTFDLNRKFAPWLLKIATNLSIDHIRRKQPKTVPLDSLEDSLGDLASPSRYSGSDPLKVAEESELGQLMEQLIAQLPPGYRAAITLYYSEGLTYGEIASALDIPIGTVKTYLYRARTALKERLKSIFRESIEHSNLRVCGGCQRF
jgi:RNA polymerase sigma-70 factor (ECF subfamily)